MPQQQLALQTLMQRALRDQVQVESAYQRLLAAWGKTIAERNDLADFAQSLVVQQSALVRVDLLLGDGLKTASGDARLFAVSDEAHAITAQFISAAPSVDSQSQGQGLFFLVPTNQVRLSPGASVTAYLPDSDEAETGIEIPREAVVHFNGQAWFYWKTTDVVFTRHEIRLEHPTANGWFMTADVKPDTRVVVGGAQMLLSEEQKSQIQTGD